MEEKPEITDKLITAQLKAEKTSEKNGKFVFLCLQGGIK